MEQKAKSALVQEKIKQMMQNRKRISTRQGGNQLKRLKSDLEPDSKQESKPGSSIRMRPRTSDRHRKEETQSMTTDSSNRNEIDTPQLITDVFERGFELSKYLSRNNMKAEESQEKLSSDPLFHTLLATKLGRLPEEEHLAMAEKEVISKLQRIKTIQKQLRSCQVAEERISSLIDARLRVLSQY